MSKGQPGFVMPPTAPPPQYPGYPNQQQGHPGQPNVYPGQPNVYPGQPQMYPSQQQMYPPQPPQMYPAQQPMYPGNQPFPAPIQQQPGSYNQAPIWYNRNIQSYLTEATTFHVKQKVDVIEALIGWETGNQYTVMDQAGHKIFYVGEESNMCFRQLCSASRAFTLTIKDTAGQTVLVVDRKLDCSCCFGFICPDSVQVSTPSGQLLGSVVEEFNILYPTFSIKDATGAVVLRIKGPFCPVSFGPCTGPLLFKVMNAAGAAVGTISKEWGGLVREFLTDADNFSISFPYDLDPSIKAVLLAALFLIDYEYFENTGDSGGRRLFG
uniref:Phospholipid scramblase n=1 Tax=Aceria tosichella TaxID=561515 RepID=A0A6G1SI79_9ACAR